ncbi:MAG: YfcE family phosphodiesterase [Deltaproteobacteria bacterium]|uniref:Phosphoesterase n=1 Tax=Candidatus Zymogenus saltonus TaxID=2844893 RepID=A0A9D8PQD3_9DELT|nr:YfcE family phosphodiesterase [Candidatus Zymogenus saltonus]
MKIGVISDTHGNVKRASLIIEKVLPLDLLLHLGDHAGDLIALNDRFDLRSIGILGNEDKTAPPYFGSDTLTSRDISVDSADNRDGKTNGLTGIESFSNEIFFTVRGIKIYATHGHTFDINPYYGEDKWRKRLKALAVRAKKEGARAVLFGHTHRPFLEVVGGVLAMNPGDVYPGAEWGHIGTIEVSDREIRAEIRRFNERRGFECLSELIFRV